MASSIPTQLAETIQTAHINRNPDPRHDANPSTAADRREPVTLRPARRGEATDDFGDDNNGEDIPMSVLRPQPRSQQLYPMPDLRFEQSYLHSIAEADTWWKVAWITTWHQVAMPFAQGILYNLALIGWQCWNQNAQLHGNSMGTRLRRWWYGVNNWKIPPPKIQKRW